MTFIKGQSPSKHKDLCNCFRCSGISWNLGHKTEYFCIDCNKKLSHNKSKRCHSCAGKTRTHTEESKRLIGLHSKVPRGKNNWLWKGGKGSERHQLMRQKEYILWRTAVFMRDNYTCIQCGSKGYIQADHIKSWADYPEFRYAIDNGRTLCLACHEKTDTFPKQFIRKEVRLS